jgi:hypothetical protein
MTWSTRLKLSAVACFLFAIVVGGVEAWRALF